VSHVEDTALQFGILSPSQAPKVGELGAEIAFVPDVNAASF
jgi:hypothetical protein